MRSRSFLVLLAIVAVIALGALYYLFQSPGAVSPAAGGPFELSPAEPAPGAAAPVFTVVEGTPVTFHLTPPGDGALHIHALSKVTVLRAGEPATLSFTADRSGRFPIEMHAGEGDGVEVGVLEVQPK